MDGVGQQFLAGARLAEEQHRAVGRRDLSNAGEDVEDGRALTYDRIEACLAPRLRA